VNGYRLFNCRFNNAFTFGSAKVDATSFGSQPLKRIGDTWKSRADILSDENHDIFRAVSTCSVLSNLGLMLVLKPGFNDSSDNL